VFCAILDVRSGEVRFANAGHNPPLLIGAGGVRFLPVQPGFMLGPVPETVYAAERVTLRAGDTIFLYTDGVTEARSPADAAYGDGQLRGALAEVAQSDPAGLIHHVRREVRRHAAGAPQSDDVTMLAIRYRGAAAVAGTGPAP